MWDLDHKEGWTLKNWCFRIVLLENTLESPFDCKMIKQANSKGNQPWIFIVSTVAEPEAPIIWPLDAKTQLTAEKDWGQEEKGMTEDEMVGCHHQLDGHEFEQTLGDSEGQGRLACCSPRGHEKSDITWWLNNNNSVYNFNKQGDNVQPCHIPNFEPKTLTGYKKTNIIRLQTNQWPWDFRNDTEVSYLVNFCSYNRDLGLKKPETHKHRKVGEKNW